MVGWIDRAVPLKLQLSRGNNISYAVIVGAECFSERHDLFMIVSPTVNSNSYSSPPLSANVNGSMRAAVDPMERTHSATGMAPSE